MYSFLFPQSPHLPLTPSTLSAIFERNLVLPVKIMPQRPLHPLLRGCRHSNKFTKSLNHRFIALR